MTLDSFEFEHQDSTAVPVVLIVDDSPTILRVIDLALTETNWKIHKAKDGLEALKLVKQIIPDLIVLDVMLPVYNGYQICSLLKKNPRFKHIPVIMLTAKTSAIDKIRGRFAHADTYLTKPFSKSELLDACKTHLRRLKADGKGIGS
ncbi:MAG TPA: response regulator [Caldisericia bacterium]|nr:response regulator [Caldisericia bacterium]HPF49689.1 response regulator [Caldisericia bacterium]HPI84538.1 response regulator [Caldisericia bacterium]HPQ93653.1 response regulator [Caldisericia bacterium]HRV74783.1 response regulator [Caldisericia bacterium]